MRISIAPLIALLALGGCATIGPPPAASSVADSYVSANSTCRVQIPSAGASFSEFYPPDERLLIVGTMKCAEGTCRLIDMNHDWGLHRIALRLTADGAITGSPISLSLGNVLLGSPHATPESCRFLPATPKITDPPPTSPQRLKCYKL